MKPVAIIQARMGSTRLPGKVMEQLCDDTVLGYVITRCQQSTRLASVLVATSISAVDDYLAGFVALRGVSVFRGSESDVLSRYIEAAMTVGADPVVRITADCPVIAPAVVDKAITLYETRAPDYAYIDGYPIGLGAVEVMSFSVLKQINKEIGAEQSYYREHVVPYLLEKPEKFKLAIERAEPCYYRPKLRVCVDESPDLEVVRRICEHFYPRKDFSSYEVIQFLDENPGIVAINKGVKQKTI